MSTRTAIIIGAGPAGLTAAYELLQRTDIKPIILEKTDAIGGLARTVEYKNNRLDIGPHRFFSKSDRVMDWWLKILPMEHADGQEHEISYHNKTRTIQASHGSASDDPDKKMLLIDRKTRIYYLRKLFDYPISLKLSTIQNLGVGRTFRIGMSYMKAAAMPIKPETNLEHFLINRFGRELYLTFFKDYTEKVWGVPCEDISAAWGAQRIKGLNIGKALKHALIKLSAPTGDVKQKNTETSLVERFLFPKLGTGQMWEEVARQVAQAGGQIIMNTSVERIVVEGDSVSAVEAIDEHGNKTTYSGDVFFSTMPMKDLVAELSCDVPPSIREISDGLVYRDFVLVGVLANKLNLEERDQNSRLRVISDNWIYVQESDVRVGRIDIWNNWGGGMVADPSKVWMGLEYFCNENDDLWRLTDEEMIALAKEELQRMRVCSKDDILDAMVIRVPKTYPGYFGTYDRFSELTDYIDRFQNLFLIGRNGQHKYNNQDHSMLAAMTAVDNIVSGQLSKENVWAVNTEMDYHEEK